MSGDSEHSHRQSNRFRSGIHAEIDAGSQTISCEAQNISRGGTLLVGEFPAPPEGTVEFRLVAPAGNLTVSLTGRVIRVEPGTEVGVLHVALEFVDMDDARRSAIEALLSRLLQTPPRGPFDSLKPGSPPQEIKKVLEAIPLPQRIALAARAGPREREILRLDSQPAVLESLARNPSLTIAEARALATSAYLMTGTLDALAQDQRFKDDEELCMAIAIHPRVSLSTGERVTAHLKVPQITKLLKKPGLSQVLREKLFRKTTLR